MFIWISPNSVCLFGWREPRSFLIEVNVVADSDNLLVHILALETVLGHRRDCHLLSSLRESSLREDHRRHQRHNAVGLLQSVHSALSPPVLTPWLSAFNRLNESFANEDVVTFEQTRRSPYSKATIVTNRWEYRERVEWKRPLYVRFHLLERLSRCCPPSCGSW